MPRKSLVPRRRITISIPESLYKRAIEYAKERGYNTFSDLVADALRKMLEG